jgi:hypothetical protein
MKLLSFILVCLFTVDLYATVTISRVSNASNEVNLKTTTTGSTAVGTISVLGGISGATLCPVGGSTTPVNTCTLGTNRISCNKKTICPNAELSITLKAEKSGTILLVDSDNNPVDITGDVTYSSGQQATIQVLWSKICEEIGAGVNCDIPGKTETLKIGVNEAGDNALEDYASISFGIYSIPDLSGESLAGVADAAGVDDYYLFPGDAKAIVQDFSILNDNYSVTGAAKIIGFHGFSEIGTCSSAAATVNIHDVDVALTLDDNKDIEESRIDGLSNGDPYLFMFGLEDEAGNIGLFKDLVASCSDISTGGSYDRNSVTPLPVSGFLDQNQNCYITTAAYGSPLHAKVKTFKRFRDEILKSFSLGRDFIAFYYRTSPPIADQIRHNDLLRFGVRAVLWPAWAISAAVLYLGLMPFLFVITMTLLSFVFLRNKKVKKKLLILFLIFSIQPARAEEGFFSTTESTKAKPAPVETAPKEPPYSGTENDEFSDIEKSTEQSNKAEEVYEPEIEQPSKKSYSTGVHGESPDKWRPFQRVPDEKRLEELSDDGLMKITKKGGYNYKVEPSEQKSAASFRIGTASFPNLVSDTKNFSDVYGSSAKPMLLVDYEWQIFKSFGKLGIKVGSGLMMASGHGQFDSPTPVQTPTGPTFDAQEKYNFYMFPNSLSAIYRLDIFHNQWIVPFGEAGIDYLTFLEIRDDAEDIKFGGSPHFHFAVGGSFLLDTLGRDMMTEIDKQYGVNHMWLTAEFRHLESLGSNFDFSDDIIDAGIMVEF